MTIKSIAVAKVAAVATTLAMATSLLSLAPVAHAQTTTTTTTTSCSIGTADLTMGASGAAVTCLQQALIAAGFTIPAGATGYFGTQTKAAVAMWQSSRNIAPAVGYFGPISRAAWNLGGGTTTTTTSTVPGCVAGAMFSSTTGQSCASAMTLPVGCTSAAGFSPVTGVSCSTTASYAAGCSSFVGFSSTTGLSCATNTNAGTGLTGSGRLTNVSSLGDVTSDLKEGDSAMNVVGVSADATGGDVAVQRVDATFYIDDVGSQSSNLDKYFSSVSLYLDGTKLATMDPAMGDKDGRIWTLRFSGLNGVIKSGKTGQIYVKVTPLSSIGTNEAGKTVTAAILTDGVRAVGADGISHTYVAGSSFSTLITSPTTATGFSQTVTVSTVTTGTLTVSAGSDNPKASQIAVSSSTTTGVKLLTFSLKAKNQDVEVTDLAISLGTNDSLSDVVSNVKLMQGSNVISSKTVSAGTYGVVTFTNVNKTISKDATENYWISADLKGDAAYPDGTTIVASTTVSGWDVSDADGASVTPSAAAVGYTMTLTATGISVVKGTFTKSQTTGLSGAGDTVTFTMPFTVTAGDSDIYIGSATTKLSGPTVTPSASAGGLNFATSTGSTQGATGEPQGTALTAADTLSGDVAGAFKVTANTSRTLTFTTTFIATTTGAVTAGNVGAQIVGINYGPTSTLGTTYYTSNLDSFKTDLVFVTKR